jgi:hypothetical protein
MIHLNCVSYTQTKILSVLLGHKELGSYRFSRRIAPKRSKSEAVDLPDRWPHLISCASNTEKFFKLNVVGTEIFKLYHR